MAEFKLSEAAELVITRLEEAGFPSFAVGGSVRDFLMGKAPHDFDVATSATPEEMKALFKDYTIFQYGASHGTIAMNFKGETVEMTTFRCDGSYKDHRHPESVRFSERIEDDLARRDFTVNAMAYSRERGIVDLFGGSEDIGKRLIKCVGDPEKRFEEDALRIFRALRFASVLDFKIEEKTKKALLEKKELLSFVSRERLTEELKKFLDGDAASRVAEELYDVFEFLFEGVPRDFGKALARAEKGTPRLAVFLSLLPDFEKGMRSLTLIREEKELIGKALRLAENFRAEGEIALKSLVSENGKDAVTLALKVLSARGENVTSLVEIVANSEEITPETLKIKGRDVVAEGVPPSAEVGKIIDSLVNDVIEGKIENDREELLSALREKIKRM